MQTTAHPVELAYSRAELLALFQAARQADVERGGRYDVPPSFSEPGRPQALAPENPMSSASGILSRMSRLLYAALRLAAPHLGGLPQQAGTTTIAISKG